MNYTINYNLTRVETTGNTTIQILPSGGYALPSSITVTNGTLVSYDATTGIAVLSNVTANTTIDVVCAPAQTEYTGTITNGGYIPAEVFIDHDPAFASAEYTLIDEGATISCQNYVIIAEDVYQLHGYVSSNNCTYEEYEFDDYQGYIVYPTANNWTFEAQFFD